MSNPCYVQLRLTCFLTTCGYFAKIRENFSGTFIWVNIHCVATEVKIFVREVILFFVQDWAVDVPFAGVS